MDGFDDCIIGVMERFGMEPIVVYDKNAVIKKHMEDGMDEEEAYEFFEHNQIRAWVGERTPAFLDGLNLLSYTKVDMFEVEE
jgi:hypothetical protein